MAYTVTPALNDVYTAVKALIVVVTGLPASSVIQGLQNRAAMPLPQFVTMQALNYHRLRTNVHSWNQADPLVAAMTVEMGKELVVQIDCYGPLSEAWATALSAILRDQIGCDALAPVCQPLYADDARMVEFVDSEEQYEQRWSVDAHLQVNSDVTAPQQFANTAKLSDFISVEERFPA